MNLTDRTLYLFVNCCVEQSRFVVAKQVIEILNEQQTKNDVTLRDDLIVFDNGSMYPGTIEMLENGFRGSRIVRAAKNEGFWSAINWVLQNYTSLIPNTEKYKYFHVIESDHTYYDLLGLVECERRLDEDLSMGGIRLQEYDLNQRNLYDKTLGHPHGKHHAWVSHVNHVTGECVKFGSCISNFSYKILPSNFLTCLHSLNRIDTMIDVFKELSTRESFSENDFQRLYHQRYPNIGIYNGGIFHAKLGGTINDRSVVAGSWTPNLKEIGYMTTRVDKIRSIKIVP